ncbi:LysE family translocator [Marinobacterium jannaschii]|uniref:LysE family translocator n=1 Tax=Marinobacterium jannaschii TaxID=64970 RepID=UPI0004874E49|nr:LysE family translocator [Marinobacterium jannaschii]
MLSLYLNFCLFAFIASITPGPSNLISLMIGTRRGIWAALPFIWGASVCMTLILWLAGAGLAPVIVGSPLLKLVMSWGGGLWMSWLAWKLFFAAPSQAGQDRGKTIGWLQGAALQLVNPKAWMMALSTTAIFSLPDAQNLQHTSMLAALFFLVAVPCQLCWSWLGQSAAQLAGFPRWEVKINRILALALLATVWSALLMTGV